MNKEKIQVEIEDISNGIYSVRLYVAADSPDNLDKQVSIGWVNLDTNLMKALDMTRDPEHPSTLKVNTGKYQAFISDCIPNQPTAESNCDDLNKRVSEPTTNTPHSEKEMTVVGSGRLQFYSAPNYSCKMPGIFILAGESVDTYTSRFGFTLVTYQNSKKTSPVRGWVKSSRLQSNDLD